MSVATGHRDALPGNSRYRLLAKIAQGGMATVYVARLSLRAGVRRIFALKRAHAHLVDDAAFRRMFVAEARLASRVHHPNVVAVQDVEELDGELLLIMDYVEGGALADLRPLSADARLRARLAVRIVLEAARGLEAAHDLADDDGRPLDLVHRDVSPHNLLVGVDGVTRVTDFGVAKSALHTGAPTTTGGLKGKLAYMAPEYIEGARPDRRIDVFALGVVLWEALAGERLFKGQNEVELMRAVTRCEVPLPSSLGAPGALDAVTVRALARDPAERFASMGDFAAALTKAAGDALLGTHAEVAQAVTATLGPVLASRRMHLAGMDRESAPDAVSFDRDEDTATATVDAPAESVLSITPTAPSPVPAQRSRGRGVVMLAACCVGALALGVAMRPRDHGARARDHRVDHAVAVVAAPGVSSFVPPSPSSAPSMTGPAATESAVPAPSSARVRAPREVPSAPVASSAPLPSAPPSSPDRAPPNPYRPGPG